MPLLTRKAQVALAIESVEGTAETLDATNATFLPYDPAFAVSPGMFDDQPSRSTLTPLTKVIGKQPATVTFRTPLKGSGSGATRPSWDPCIRCCGFSSAAVSSISVTSMTGTFLPGESFTVTTTSQTGRIVGRYNSASQVYFVPGTGTVATGMTVVGDTSGASAVTNGALTADRGWEYRPASSSVPSATVGMYRDGLRHLMAGARGNVTIEGRVGEPVFLNFSFSGVYQSVADVALLSPTYESSASLPLLAATTYMDSLAAVFASLTIDMQNVLSERESAAAAKGILSQLITGRAPRLQIDPEMVLVATKDFYGRMIAASTGYFHTVIGSSAGNTVHIGAPKIQYASVGQSDGGGRALAPLEFDLVAASVSTGDNELQIGVL